MDSRKIIQQYLTTEKSSITKEIEQKYTFKVDRRATKDMIKRAVEDLFKVDVVSVRTIIMPGKVKTMGRYSGKTPTWKKAIVKLQSEETISEFENL